MSKQNLQDLTKKQLLEMATQEGVAGYQHA